MDVSASHPTHDPPVLGEISRRERLALVGGLVPPDERLAQGTKQASHRFSAALLRSGRFRAIDRYGDDVDAVRRVEKSTANVRARRSALLPLAPERYHAIYVSEGAQSQSAPVTLRPYDDWAPVIYNLGTTHARTQWLYLLTSALDGAFRPTDGLIVKSTRQATILRDTWAEWRTRFGAGPCPHVQTIPNGVDLTDNRADAKLRAETRALLRLHDDDCVFLAFSRLSPHNEG